MCSRHQLKVAQAKKRGIFNKDVSVWAFGHGIREQGAARSQEGGAGTPVDLQVVSLPFSPLHLSHIRFIFFADLLLGTRVGWTQERSITQDLGCKQSSLLLNHVGIIHFSHVVYTVIIMPSFCHIHI